MTPSDIARLRALCDSGEWIPGVEWICRSAVPRLLDELELLRKGPVGWEADHQRAALERHDLADEFPFGCDAIEHVAEALVATRKRLEAALEVVQAVRDFYPMMTPLGRGLAVALARFDKAKGAK